MIDFVPVSTNYKHDYNDIFKTIASGRINDIATYQQLCEEDLFFVLCFGLQRPDINHPWLIDRIRELEDGPKSDTMDLWAREHYKSTIITYGETIQDIIKNPEERIGLFSQTRPLAKDFLRQIKLTLEDDDIPIKNWFPHIFYHKPKTQAHKWSEDEGLYVKRKGKYREATIEANGLVEGMPTGRHYSIIKFDDIVTPASVTNKEQIQKTMTAYELAQS